MKVISYNIHKGLSFLGRKLILNQIKEKLSELNADIVFLQEVVGDHKGKKIELPFWESNHQLEFLAHELYPYFCYGANKFHKNGHHGNAILSRYPILGFENLDLSTNRFESRGLLFCEVETEASPIQLYCTHLNLLEKGRMAQAKRMVELINQRSKDLPVLLAGDFNDWTESLIDFFIEEGQFQEVFKDKKQSPVKSFPSFLPVLSLDRIFYKNLTCKELRIIHKTGWKSLSDHLPVKAIFEPL